MPICSCLTVQQSQGACEGAKSRFCNSDLKGGCGYAVGGAVATARPVISNTLTTTGYKGKVTKGVTRHERRREIGSLLTVVTAKNDHCTRG